MQVTLAQSPSQIRDCFPVIHQLRPHLNEETFLAQATRQMQNHGYQLAYISQDGIVLAAAGYRIAEFLAWGKILYVDDLITLESEREKGCAGILMDWLADQARSLGCAQIHLDSGVQRFNAHRLYLKKRMDITGHHFARNILSRD